VGGKLTWPVRVRGEGILKNSTVLEIHQHRGGVPTNCRSEYFEGMKFKLEHGKKTIQRPEAL